MSTKTNYTTAAALLRTHGAPSFVVSLGTPSWSQLAADIPNPMFVRDARVATKQDRPPRGVPR